MLRTIIENLRAKARQNRNANTGARRSWTSRGLESLERREMLSAVIPQVGTTLFAARPVAARPAVVKAVASGTVDLTVQFGGLNLPVTTVSGSGAKFAVPIVVTNQGTGAVTGASSMAVNLYARPVGALDASQDVLIGTLTASVGGLQAGASKPFTASISLPLALASGNYNVVVVVNANNAITESDTSNNTAVSQSSINVTQGVVDLVAGLVKAKISASAQAGQNTSGKVTIVVTNAGDVPLPLNQNIDITLYARPVGAIGSFSDFLLVAHGESVSNLKPAHSVTFAIPVTAIPDDLLGGQYSIVAVVDSTNIVPESNENNNTGVSTDIVPIAAPRGHSSAQAVDLSVTGGTTTLATLASNGATGQATINFTNAGTNAATGTYTINIYAVGVNDLNHNATIVGSSGAQTLNLSPASAGTPTTINLTLPSPASSTTYELIAEIVASSGDINPANNILDIGNVTVSPVVPLLGFLPTSMVLSQLIAPVVNGNTSTSSGTFIGNGQSGTYTWVANTSAPNANQGTLTLTLTGSPADLATLTLTMLTGSVPVSLDGESLNFQTSSTNATGTFAGSVQSLGSLVPTGFFILD